MEQTMSEERDKLTKTIIGCAFKVSNTLGCGFLEKVYENALAIEITKFGLKCEQQKPIPVTYRGFPVGDYYADILVEGQVILEIKAAKVIDESHQAQLINYLKASGIHRGLILNIGTTKLGYKRMVF
jgi:GxxExxY protein